MCDIDWGFDGGWSFFKEKVVKARIEHTCASCRRTIEPGEKYIRHFSVFDTYPTSQKSCYECHEVMEKFADEHSWRTCPSDTVSILQDCIENEEDQDIRDMWQAELNTINSRRRGV